MGGFRLGQGLGIMGVLGTFGLTGCFQGPRGLAEPSAPVNTVILPASAAVTVGGATSFSARVDGEPVTDVAWRVLEPSGGSVAGGLYRAPAKAGVYTVQAAFRVGAGQTAEAKVNVVEPPRGQILAPPRVLPGAADQKASIVPVPGSRYAWTLAGGLITAGTDSPSVTFQAGTGPKVTLACLVSNAAGDQLRTSLEVPVVAPVSLTISPTAVTLTAGRSMKFGFSIAGGSSLGVAWSLGEPGAGSLDQAGAYVAPEVPGRYTVRVTAQDEPTSLATAQVKVVAKPPESLFAPASFQPGAQGLRAQVPEVPGMTYAWAIEGGTLSSGAAGPVVVFQAGDGPSLTLRCTITNEAGDTYTARQELNAQ